jgi:exodeoxyribonuclease VII small subunit
MRRPAAMIPPERARNAPMSRVPRNLKFEDAMKRLDAIVEAMESGQIGIEDSIEKYEEAMALRTYCQAILDQAELRIKKIQFDASGNASETPFEPPPMTAEDENGA